MDIRQSITIIEAHLKEYNKIASISRTSRKQIDAELEKSPPIAHFSSGGVHIVLHHRPKSIWFILTEAETKQYVGYITAFPVSVTSRNVWQVKGITVEEAFQGNNIAPNAYLEIVRATGLTLINDTGLTTGGEKIWTALLGQRHVTNIFDKNTEGFYPICKIGDTATDGTCILSPPKDTSHDLAQRFFWSLQPQVPENISENVWRRHTKNYREGVALLYEGKPLSRRHAMAGCCHLRDIMGLCDVAGSK